MTIKIGLLPGRGAADQALVGRLTDLVNRVYEEGEKGLWREGAARTDESELADLIGRGQIATARLGDRPVGMVRVRRLGPALGEFGMLVADTQVQGTGIGRALVTFAEDWARRRRLPVLQLELLVPRDGEHPVKEFLRGWYTRIGYRLVGAGEVGDVHPELVPLLAIPCRFLTFHKDLAGGARAARPPLDGWLPGPHPGRWAR